MGTVDAMAHGFATFSVMTLFNELGASHIIVTILVMEVSTIILCILKASFFSTSMQIATILLFVIVFFFSRILLSPVIAYHGCMTMYMNDFSDCYPRILFYITSGFSFFFTSLNFYWFSKMIKKIQRKISGVEAIGDLERK